MRVAAGCIGVVVASVSGFGSPSAGFDLIFRLALAFVILASMSLGERTLYFVVILVCGSSVSCCYCPIGVLIRSYCGRPRFE